MEHVCCIDLHSHFVADAFSLRRRLLIVLDPVALFSLPLLFNLLTSLALDDIK